MARDPARDKAHQLWKDHKGAITNRRLSEMVGVDERKVAVWKSRDKWGAVVQQAPEKIQQEQVQRKPKARQALKDIDVPKPMEDRFLIFASEYVRDFNATRAALKAGYKKTDAYNAGYRLLRKAEIRAEVERLKQEHAFDIALDVRKVIRELTKIAFADISDVLDFGTRDALVRTDDGYVVKDEHGKPLTEPEQYVHVKDVSEVDASVIAEVKRTKDGVAIKMHDKLKALEKLERYLPYMTEGEKLHMDKVRADIKAAEMRAF